MLDRFLVSVPFWRGGSQSSSNLKERQNPVPGLADFLKLAAAWRLSDNEARKLFGVSRGLHRQLKKGRNATLALDQSTRISLLAEIYQGLHVLYGSRQADAWLRSPNSNPIFGGDKPLHYMLQGGISAVVRVRNVVGRWPAHSAQK